MSKGLIHVYTGEGKGKTTAAVGLAVRAAGHGRKVLIHQFLKGGSLDSGEIITLKKSGINIVTFREQVSPLFSPKADINELKASVAASIELTVKEMKSGEFDLIILDEFNNLLSGGLADLGDMKRIIDAKPENLELVFTGRNAPEELLVIADYVTETRMIKHPFEKGTKARKGIEF
ncbi:MAG: cob(I)yrinic acid a,c-diamide adenosyltransferase [Nitrospirae bacterium]|nr:cob(I)yrinic acid a,c-diamide adenosyltransferase [Nitrospirota bacterium]